MPFLILLVVALIFKAVPMDGAIKKIGNIIVGVAAIFLLLKYVQFF